MFKVPPPGWGAPRGSNPDLSDASAVPLNQLGQLGEGILAAMYLSSAKKNTMIKVIHPYPHFKYMENSCIIIT